MRIVLDTNVFISSFLSRTGAPRRIIDLWKRGEVTLCLTAAILEEYVEVLSRLGLSGAPEVGNLLGLLERRPNMVFTAPAAGIRAVAEDPDDDKFIECAVAAGAEVIVSGDRHLLSLGSYRTIRVVTPSDFLNQRPSSSTKRP